MRPSRRIGKIARGLREEQPCEGMLQFLIYQIESPLKFKKRDAFLMPRLRNDKPTTMLSHAPLYIRSRTMPLEDLDLYTCIQNQDQNQDSSTVTTTWHSESYRRAFITGNYGNLLCDIDRISDKNPPARGSLPGTGLARGTKIRRERMDSG